MQTSQNTAIVKKHTKKHIVFVEIENECIQILIKMHLHVVMSLALKKRPFTKERKKEEESKPEDQWSCKRSPDILAYYSTKHTKPGKYVVKK